MDLDWSEPIPTISFGEAEDGICDEQHRRVRFMYNCWVLDPDLSAAPDGRGVIGRTVAPLAFFLLPGARGLNCSCSLPNQIGDAEWWSWKEQDILLLFLAAAPADAGTYARVAQRSSRNGSNVCPTSVTMST
jgi:hypothetical protein